MSEASIKQFLYTSAKSFLIDKVKQKILTIIAQLLILAGVLFIAWGVFNQLFINMMNSISGNQTNTVQQSTLPTDANSRPPIATRIYKSLTETEPSQKPVWISGKSLSECMGTSNTINEKVLRCRDGYWSNAKPPNQPSEMRLSKIDQEQRKKDAIAQATRTCSYWKNEYSKDKSKENLKHSETACRTKLKIMKTPVASF